MPGSGEVQRTHSQALLSRRQILTGTSIGIGATLLFHRAARNRVDLPAPRARAADAPGIAARDAPGAPAGPGDRAPAAQGPLPAGVQAVEDLEGATGQPASASTTQNAVHRVQLSDQGHPRSVTRGDLGVLVVGMSTNDEPVCWLTEDGSRWIEHTLDTPKGHDAEVWGVATFDGGFIVVGTTVERTVRQIAESGIVPGDQARVTFADARHSPTVWWTSDCVRWPGRSLDQVIGPNAELIAIAGDGTRLVAVGGVLDADGVQPTHGFVVTTTDGSSWRRVDLGADAALSEGLFTAIAVGDEGWYATSVDVEGGAVWRSDDGLQWSIIEGSRGALRGVSPQGIGVRDGRLLVAAAGLLDPRPRYFVSRTLGRTWRRATFDVAMLAGPDAVVTDLAVIAGDVVIVGTHRGAPVLEGGTLYAGD